MKLSKYFFHTLKEAPGDADIESQKFFIRAGFIKKVSPGIYNYLPMGLRSIKKFENIVREEMNRAGAIEILMPVVHPRELWEESGRWDAMGKGLLKFQDRNEHWFCLGATHEEVVTDIARKEIKSYRDLPVNLYQIQTKFRDEIRPRFGLMRGKEFIMKDAYSFDVSKEKALETYKVMFKAYQNIFTRCGLNFRTVNADAGSIGGSITHEFQVLAASGEDLIMACDSCEYASNVEVTPALSQEGSITNENKAIVNGGDFVLHARAGAKVYVHKKHEEKLKAFIFDDKKLTSHTALFTPGLKTIDDLAKFVNQPSDTLAKTLFL